MNYESLAENIVKKTIKAGADEAEAYLQNSRDFELRVRNGEMETIKQATSKGIGLMVFKDKKLGFSYTSDFSEEALEEFIKKTIQLSFVADSKPWNGLPDFEQKKIKDLDLYDAFISEIPHEKKLRIAKEAEKIALNYDKRIIKSEGGYFNDSETEAIIVNSKGISHAARMTGVYFGVSVVAQEADEMQFGGWRSRKRHFKDLDTIENVAKAAGKSAVEKLGTETVSTQKAPVVIDSNAAPSFWAGILNAMNGDSNYKKTTFLTDYLDKPIASEIITVVDDPTIPRHVHSIPFDGEGNITEKNVLIDKGILKMFIYDTLTARKAGIKANTMALRYNFRFPAEANFLNVVINNGVVNLEKIISGIKNGYYVKVLRGIGTDIPTGNYSCGSAGFWIKDGEIAFPVDGITVGGNILEMLKSIEVAADDIDLRSVINSPSFKISEMTIGGM